MTAQRTDTIIIDENENRLYSLPLSQYLIRIENKITFFGSNTGLSRGYYAKWLLENNRFYLIDFWGENILLGKEYSLKDLFPNEIKIFAKWFTGDLSIPVGKEINYFHAGLGGSVHEYYAIIKIENGLVIESIFNDNS